MKIALVGTSVTSRAKAPYEDSSWQIWSTARNYDMGKRYDRWFELHGIEYLKNLRVEPEHLKFLESAGNKLILREPYPDYPDAILYPKDEVLEYFRAANPRLGKYFTSSIAWMLGMAIMQGPEEIGIWGVDMALDEEYGHQRCCCEALLGFAIGKGIKISLPDETPLLRSTHLYGFESPPPMAQMLLDRVEEAEKDREIARAELKNAAANINHRQGMIDAFREMQRLL